MATFASVQNISKYFVLQIVNNHIYFKTNLVIAPVEWFRKEPKSKKVYLRYPDPPFEESFIKGFAEKKITSIPESWGKYSYEVRGRFDSYKDAENFLIKNKPACPKDLFNLNSPIEESLANKNAFGNIQKAVVTELNQQALTLYNQKNFDSCSSLMQESNVNITPDAGTSYNVTPSRPALNLTPGVVTQVSPSLSMTPGVPQSLSAIMPDAGTSYNVTPSRPALNLTPGVVTQVSPSLSMTPGVGQPINVTSSMQLLSPGVPQTLSAITDVQLVNSTLNDQNLSPSVPITSTKNLLAHFENIVKASEARVKDYIKNEYSGIRAKIYS